MTQGTQDTFSLVSSAIAQDGSGSAAGAPPQPSLGTSMLPILLIVVVFYFLIFRPQKKRLDSHRQMVESLQKGSKVVTAGGIIGKITKVEDGNVELEIATDTKIQVVKSTISEVIDKEAEKAAKKEAKEAAKEASKEAATKNKNKKKKAA